MSDFIEFMTIKSEEKVGQFHFICYEPLLCVNGISISVQAGQFLRSQPQKMLPLNEYTHFEISVCLPEEIAKHFEMTANEEEVVGNVPKQEIQRMIAYCGGLKVVEEIKNEKKILERAVDKNTKKSENKYRF